MTRRSLALFVVAVGAGGCQALPTALQTPTWQADINWSSSNPQVVRSVRGHTTRAPLERVARRTTIDAAAARGRPKLGVVSFNMQHRDNPRQLATMADRLESDLSRMPDFILCQEVLFNRAIKRGSDNTAGVLARELGYHCRGTKRRSDREGLAIVSRYPFAWYDELHLQTRTSALLLGFRRVSVMGEFFIPEVGRVRVVNVHFAYQTFEHRVRRKQLEETLQWIAARERRVPAAVTILGGDFNIEPHWSEFTPLRDLKITGGMVYENWNSSAPTRGPKGSPDARIDYIFISAPQHDVAMMGERLLFVRGLSHRNGRGHFYLSDHVPLLHEYAIGPQPTLAATPALPRLAPRSRTAGFRPPVQWGHNVDSQ